MIRRISLLLSLFVFSCWGNLLQAQASMGGDPYFFTQPAFLTTTTIPPPDVTIALVEDADHPSTRFSLPIATAISPSTHGQWIDLENGDRVWWLKIHSKDALGLGVFYEQFDLPRGARLYMFSEDGEQILGAYTARNNPKSGKFLTGFLQGTSAVIEYYEPQSARGSNPFLIDNCGWI